MFASIEQYNDIDAPSSGARRKLQGQRFLLLAIENS